MAAHKVPQDVEADDKFFGPLSFKQFVFFGIAAICGYVTFFLITKGLWPIAIVFFVPAAMFGILAFPWSKEQPTEIWLAARIRFFIKPRKRIWNQSGVKDLVTITVPKREAKHYSDGLSQGEVRHRFSALASMIDSRGWAVKNYDPSATEESDRLVAGNIDPTNPVASTPAANEQDVFGDNSVIAQQFDSMIQRAAQSQHSQTQNLVAQARAQAQQGTGPTSRKKQQNDDYWFMHQQAAPADPSLATFGASPVVTPGATNDPTVSTSSQQISASDEQQLLQKAHEKQMQHSLQTTSRHEKVIDPHGNVAATRNKPDIPPLAQAPNPDILTLSTNNDRSVESLAREVNKKDDDGEVVISLR